MGAALSVRFGGLDFVAFAVVVAVRREATEADPVEAGWTLERLESGGSDAARRIVSVHLDHF